MKHIAHGQPISARCLGTHVSAVMDMECLRIVKPLLDGCRAVFGVENTVSSRATRRLNIRHREQIANFIFAAEAGHPLFEEIIARLEALPGQWDMGEEVLETTGPGMLTDLVQEHRARMGLTILPRNCWAPSDWWPSRFFPFDRHIYARHYFAGTWKSAFPGQKGGGILVRPRFFDGGLFDYAKAPPEAFFVDDVWVSGHLARRGIAR